MTNMQLRFAKKHAHERLLFAVIGFNGARRNGSQIEIIEADAELLAAQEESLLLICPPERRAL